MIDNKFITRKIFFSFFVNRFAKLKYNNRIVTDATSRAEDDAHAGNQGKQ